MAHYNFKGDVGNLTELQQKFIHVAVNEMCVEYRTLSFQPVGKAGDNYVASVKRITVEGKEEHKNFTFIAKIAPTFDDPELSSNISVSFVNEHLMYTEVLPKFAQLEKDANIPEEEQLRFAKCYGSLTEPGQEVILFEDLKTAGFIMLDRFISLSDECVKSVLKNFALLHSLSFVLRHKEPEKYEYYKENLNDIWDIISNDENLKKVFQGLDDETIILMDDPEHKTFVKHKIVNAISSMVKLSRSKYDSKFTVIHQGDPWTNNIMFKFEGDKLTNSVMVDYQLSYSTSPVCDLLYMIFGCTDYNTRKLNYYNWIDYYHSELDKSLSNFNLKASDVYPRDLLDVELKEYGKYQFGQAAFLASNMVKKPSEAEKMKDGIKSGYENKSTEIATAMGVLALDEESKTLYKNKIIGLINSFKEFGFL